MHRSALAQARSSCAVSSRAAARSQIPLLGRTRFAVQPLGPPLEDLSVIAMVPAPPTPTEAGSLLRAVAMLTVLLVGAAGMVAYVFANDVRNDVTYVRHRIAEMAAADTDPAGAPIPIRALDQVGVLTAAFNQLVGRFASAERSYREDLTFASALDGERSAFLAALSHELRTPLNGILGFADVLLSEVEGTLDEATREELGVIRASASHLRSLIDDILELSALESGGLKLRREPVDVYAVAEEVVREQRPLAADKKLGLELSGTAHPLRSPTLSASGRSWATSSATPSNSRRAAACASRWRSENDEVVVHTIDTGPGIAPAERAAIFEEYAQAGDVATRRKGTGLGLAIARRLVAMHGGVIELESTLGQGSRFTFKLLGRDASGRVITNHGADAVRVFRSGVWQAQLLLGIIVFVSLAALAPQLLLLEDEVTRAALKFALEIVPLALLVSSHARAHAPKPLRPARARPRFPAIEPDDIARLSSVPGYVRRSSLPLVAASRWSFCSRRFDRRCSTSTRR